MKDIPVKMLRAWPMLMNASTGLRFDNRRRIKKSLVPVRALGLKVRVLRPVRSSLRSLTNDEAERLCSDTSSVGLRARYMPRG